MTGTFETCRDPEDRVVEVLGHSETLRSATTCRAAHLAQRAAGQQHRADPTTPRPRRGSPVVPRLGGPTVRSAGSVLTNRPASRRAAPRRTCRTAPDRPPGLPRRPAAQVRWTTAAGRFAARRPRRAGGPTRARCCWGCRAPARRSARWSASVSGRPVGWTARCSGRGASSTRPRCAHPDASSARWTDGACACPSRSRGGDGACAFWAVATCRRSRGCSTTGRTTRPIRSLRPRRSRCRRCRSYGSWSASPSSRCSRRRSPSCTTRLVVSASSSP